MTEETLDPELGGTKGTTKDESGTTSLCREDEGDGLLSWNPTARVDGGDGFMISNHHHRHSAAHAMRGPHEQAPKDETASSTPPTLQQERPKDRLYLFVILTLVVGAAASAAFIAFGIENLKQEQQRRFENEASEFTTAVQASWENYEMANLWVHEACRATADQSLVNFGRFPVCTREDFHELYLYLKAGGIDFTYVAFLSMIFGQREREALETESRAYYAQRLPGFDYQGITAVEYLGNYTSHAAPENNSGFTIRPQSEQPLYFVSHRVEPLEQNLWVVDFDFYSIVRPTNVGSQEHTSVQNWQPLLSERWLPIGDSFAGEGYHVYFFHPGIDLPDHVRSQFDASLLSIYPSDVLRGAGKSLSTPKEVYLFDNFDFRYEEPAFLAGARLSMETIVDLEELGWSDVSERSDCMPSVIPVVNREWTVVVCQVSGTFDIKPAFTVLGGLVVFIACLCLATWFYTTSQRNRRINKVIAMADQEKSALIVQNAERAAETERELNEYLAHEIRNPLAAAISACSFVSSAAEETNPLQDEEQKELFREDVHVISSSLQFANDLLRSILDMQKVHSNRMNIEMTPCSILEDILEPIGTMLLTRNNSFQVEYDCSPRNLTIETDRVRLKQIMFNLAGNSRKFVQKGFIRLGARVVAKNSVELWVEDSGPGIPLSKHKNLFQKYQESLDVLSQGTGMGLCLCKGLSELLDGDLALDTTYVSGIDGCPGTRFVLTLSTSHMDLDCDKEESPLPLGDPASNVATIDSIAETSIHSNVIEKDVPSAENETSTRELSCSESSPIVFEPPENLSVLLVDDDMILRRLISRTLKKVAPTWTIKQAASGETAIRLVEDGEEFDLILMDQYMASVERTLLGTETVQTLRTLGVESIICGLSANDMERQFLDCGANAFLQKPIPCGRDQILEELRRVFEAGSTVK